MQSIKHLPMKSTRPLNYSRSAKNRKPKPTGDMILLPPHKDGQPKYLLPLIKKTVILGANGAGKTRFTERLISDLGERAYRISILDALFDSGERRATGLGPEAYFNREMMQSQTPIPANGFEMLLVQLMHDELTNLIGFKLARTTNPEATLRHTRLDTVISLWQEIFPDNRVLIDGGKFLFTRLMDSDKYSAVRLSEGEKAVFYHIGAITYAPHGSIIVVERPEMLLHPTISISLWNKLEQLRPDCRWVYTTHDVEFTASREGAEKIWVRECDTRRQIWEYEIFNTSGIPDEVYMAIMGSRKPVLFIEGDGIHSLDVRLYPLIFKDYTVKSLGSCDKVIEATRTFNDLNSFHQLDSRGIVDRDRRDDKEVEYLRKRRIMVPEVAEIENIFLLEDVIKAVASELNHDETKVFNSVRKSIMHTFATEVETQALQHTRHRIKRMVEHRIDARFPDISTMEKHIQSLPGELNPREIYDSLLTQFRKLISSNDYAGVLKVFNWKPMLTQCNIAGLLGLESADEYRDTVLDILRNETEAARRIRRAVSKCFLV